ncbi:transglycosylase domain-containing protein [Leucobacter weissii]|uniref:Transglycosylase domain-containing protein n=1 Tax=Leucobacter weissii TaxID=1983706 RepID=A0A939S835_9MICO|nr:transglycosylase domain-containing protein [Leucobacter weissii]
MRTARPRTAGGALGGFIGAVVMSVVAGILITAAVTPVVALSGMAANSAISIFNELPDHLNPGQLAQPSTIYAKKGDKKVEVATFYSQDRKMVEWNDISQYVKDAAVAVEDPRFYTHGGVDLRGVGRAALGQVSGMDTGGASTITMQYVRNVLVEESRWILDEKESEAAFKDATREDVDRKLKEMRYAISVEKEYSKDEILLGYLNIALFGRQVYGIEAAANYYYNTTAKDLTLSQAASLIAIVNWPSELQIDIEENIEKNQLRRDDILGRMLDQKRITQAEYDKAVSTEIKPDITPHETGCAVAESKRGLGHFCNYVQLYIMQDPSFGNTPEERYFNFLRGGYDITTTVDLDIQKAGLEAVKSVVPPRMDGLNVGAASVSVKVGRDGAGEVLAMVQNRPFNEDPEFLKKNKDYTSINYNTDYEYGGSGGFQVGSTFKPVTLAEWLRQGKSVRDIVNVNSRTVEESSIRASCLPGGVYGYGSFTFTNDNEGTRGNQSVLTAIARSVNGGLVSMQQGMDLCDTFETAEKLGIHRASDLPASESDPDVPFVPTLNGDFRDLSMVPSNVYGGIDEIAPITMAAAYGAFASDGTVCTPVPIKSITGPDGEDVPFTKSKCSSALSPDVAAGVAYALQYTVENGLATHARSAAGIPHLAKTGTTDDVVDNWTVGASTEVATATWVGNVKGKVSTQGFGNLMYADQTIWPAMMNVADQKYGGEAFPEPASSALQQTMANVPDVRGRSYEEAERLLVSAGFTVSNGGTQDSSVAEGQVAGTNPEGGSSVAAGSGITVYISNASMTALPDVAGQTLRDAAATMRSAGFTSFTFACSGEGTPRSIHEVVSTNPSGGSDAKRSNRVTLTVDCS